MVSWLIRTVLDLLAGMVQSLESCLFFQWLPGSINAMSYLVVPAIKIILFLLLLFFLAIFALRIWRKEGLVVMPFDIFPSDGKEKFSGKAISELLTYELQRILDIHSQQFEGTSIKLENLSVPSLMPKSETLAYSIGEVGTVSAGSVSLPIGALITAIKRICPYTDPEKILTGSLQSYGSTISLFARLEAREIRAWHVSYKMGKYEREPDEYLPDLVRGLAFQIAFDLSRTKNQSAQEVSRK
jgi:hypothetical protein